MRKPTNPPPPERCRAEVRAYRYPGVPQQLRCTLLQDHGGNHNANMSDLGDLGDGTPPSE